MTQNISSLFSWLRPVRMGWLRCLLSGACVVLAVLLVPAVPGASQFYDGANGTTTWDTISPVWGTVSGGPYNTVWSGGNDAFFEGTPTNVTGTAASVQNITFNSLVTNSPVYNIQTTTVTLAGTTNPSVVEVGTNLDGTIASATISGVIAGSGISLAKTGAGTLTLSGNNTFSGNMSINAGTVNAGTIGSNGVASALGAGPVLGMGGTAVQGILNYTGAGNTSDRVIDLQGTIAGGTMQLLNNGSGPLVFVGNAGATNAVGSVPGAAVTTSPANVSKALTLGGSNTMANNIIGNIINPGGGTSFKTSINKVGPGTWGISGANNTYTSTLNVNQGTLFFGADDPITATATVWVNTATVDLRGHHVIVNQNSLLIMGINTPSVTPANAGGSPVLLDSVGGGKLVLPTAGLIYNSGLGTNLNGQGLIACNIDVTNVNPKALQVEARGLAEPDLVISGVISSDATTGGIELNADLTYPGGVLKLTGANTYAGQTRIAKGTLVLGANNTLPFPPKSGNNLTLRSRFVPLTTLDLFGTTNSINNLTLGDAANILGSNQMLITNSVGSGLLKMGGSLTYNPGTVGSGFETGPATITGNLDLNGTNRTFTVNDSPLADPEVFISGVIQNSMGSAGLTKAGTGVLVLAGTNTYNGNTTVSGGVLSLSVPTLVGTVSIGTNAILNLNFAGQNTVSNLVLDGVIQPAGTYDASVDATHFSGTGQLVVAGAELTPYAVGDTNAPGLLPAALLAAYQGGYSNVTINPGTYVMSNGNNAAFTFNGWKNFTVNASNALFIVVGNGRCFDLRYCTNVMLKGATARPLNYPWSQGRVLSIGTNAGTLYCDWQISPGYSVTNWHRGLNAVFASNQLISMADGDVVCYPNNQEYLGNRTWRLNFPGRSRFYFQTNDWLVSPSLTQQQCAYGLWFCSNCTFAGCIAQSMQEPYIEQYSGGNHMLGCRIEPAPLPPPGGAEMPLCGSAAGGSHGTHTYPGMDWENCVFTGVMLDDNFAVQGNYHDVVSVSGSNITFAPIPFFVPHAFAVGDPVRISSKTGTYLTQATCIALANLPNGDVQVTLDQVLSLPADTWGSNPKYNGDGFRIINCQGGNTRSRGIIAKADNGLITGNTIRNATLAAIQIGPEGIVGEADYVRNVVVTSNNIIHCGKAGISYVSDGAAGNRNITIENNYFQSTILGSAIDLSGCGEVIISGNTYLDPLGDYYPVRLNNSTNITFSRNLINLDAEGRLAIGNSLLGKNASVTGIHNEQNGIILTGVAYTISNRLSNLVLDDPAGGGAGTQVVQQNASGGDDKSWILSPIGNGYCAVVCAANGLVLGVNGSVASNAPVVMETYAGVDSQIWAMAPVTNNYIALTNKLSGMVVDAGTGTPGLGLVQKPFNGSANQQWSLLLSPAVSSNSVVFLQAKAPGSGTNSLTFAGVTGYQYVAQYTTNLVTGPWFDLNTNILGASGLWQVIDPNVSTAQRFYRGRRP